MDAEVEAEFNSRPEEVVFQMRDWIRTEELAQSRAEDTSHWWNWWLDKLEYCGSNIFDHGDYEISEGGTSLQRLSFNGSSGNDAEILRVKSVTKVRLQRMSIVGWKVS